MSTAVKTEIQRLLAERRLRPQKKFGQNFLLDHNLLTVIADYATADDYVLEVGPGTGRLTEKLLATGAEVFAVEIDRGLAALLQDRLGDRANFQLLRGDILSGKNALNAEALATVAARRGAKKNLRCIANLPYSAGTPFIANLCAEPQPWQTAIFLLQYEVAERLFAAAGTDHYGGLAARAALAGKGQILRPVPPEVFYPRPAVKSALVKFDFFPAAERAQIDWQTLDILLAAIFQHRRKTLAKCLREKIPPAPLAAALAATDLTGNERGEDLSPDTLRRLSVAAAEFLK
ncbi:ribosomal RNA small subunit methyltransferase A [Planctomycetales bacterium]|nr:ribosomal RNA small subunit methyltransferase A [Planctomycetales bacterium]